MTVDQLGGRYTSDNTRKAGVHIAFHDTPTIECHSANACTIIGHCHHPFRPRMSKDNNNKALLSPTTRRPNLAFPRP